MTIFANRCHPNSVLLLLLQQGEEDQSNLQEDTYYLLNHL